ncbi:hypothetical protein V2595_15205, partial [Tenacibaculum maritimum]|uniref:hypothetical protein n=1 Tax=Tenacibaculum maritimum TaxID=107401 RepID=UPI0038766CC6
DLWFSYIKKRLFVDSEEKQIKKGVNPTLIEFYSKKVSLINELSRTNSFTEERMLRVTNNNSSDLNSFLLNPMLEKNINQNVWYFEHKNIQEYFASKTLSDLEFDKILEFIQIKDIGRTHPALFNTITFLINILEDSVKFDKLIEWIVANEPELLFRADTNRVTEKIKVEVFQKYFTKKAIEETLWLTTNETIEIDKISRFSDCPDNYDFLLGVIENDSINIRARISAINVLRYFEIPLSKKESLKSFFWSYLISKEHTKDFKSTILEFFHYNFHYNKDQELISELVNLFINDSHNRINRKLLDLLGNYDDINAFSDYILEEFLRSNNLKERKDSSDNVGRGNSYSSLVLLLKISKPEIFCKLINDYLSNSHNSYINDSDLEKIIQKVVSFSKNDSSYILSFFNIDNKVAFHSHRNFLYRVIELTNSQTSVLLYLLQKEELKEVSFFVSKLVNKSNIDDVCSIIPIKEKEIEYFRNDIGRFNRDLAVVFDEKMRERGFQFKEKVFTNEDEIERDNQLKNERQNLLNTLFDGIKLHKGIEEFYQENAINEINYKEFIDIIYRNRKYSWGVNYDDFNASIEMIRSVLIHYNSIKMNHKQIIDEIKRNNFLIIN